MQPIQDIYSHLSKPSIIVITMHQKPDADAMGSALGLYHFLLQGGHTVSVISPTNWAAFLNWMPACNTVLDYERDTEKADALVQAAEYIFCLDFNVLSRTKKMEAVLSNATGMRVLIDHHQEPQVDKFSFGISNTEKSSTAEMVYDFICGSGLTERINLPVAECIYAGVMADTGSFRFPYTSSNVHRMVADLKDRGLNHTAIHQALFDNFSENRLRFIGHVLVNRMEVFYEYNTALIAIPAQDLVKFDIKTGDTEGLVNYPLSIEGIRLAAIIIDRGEERKCSFRSKGNFDVNTFGRKYFSGGGHFNAAGGQSREPFDQVVKDFVSAMKENRKELSDYDF